MDDNFSQPDLELEEHEIIEDVYTYTCSVCHTTFNSANSALKNCIFCGESQISQVDLERSDQYSYLPFSVSLEEAYDLYKKQIRYNVLVPFAFRGKKILKKIQKAYIPCSLYNMSIEGNAFFYGSDQIKNVRNVPKLIFDCKYSTHFDYFNLLISNYAKIDDIALSNINDYDYTSMTDFDSIMTKDSYLIAGDLDITEVTEKVQEKVMKHCVGIVRGSVGHELKKLYDNQMKLGISSTKSVLVPVYFINFRYQGQEYLFLVNGQTKKMIIDLPISVWNLVLFCMICFGVLALIGSIVAYFM